MAAYRGIEIALKGADLKKLFTLVNVTYLILFLDFYMNIGYDSVNTPTREGMACIEK